MFPPWATWEHFAELGRKGLVMYGQMTAGSWIYIGSQGIVQGTYETFVEMARQHFDGDATGRWILTAGLGGMGAAQPLAATMAGYSMLAVECDESRIDFCLRTGYLDRKSTDLDEAVAIVRDACRGGEAVSVGLLGNAAEVLPEMVARGIRPDVVTDQTSVLDPVHGYLPAGWSIDEWRMMATENPDQVAAAAAESMALHVKAMLAFHNTGIPTVDYGDNIRQQAADAAVADAFDFPGFVPAYIRPLFTRGIGPFRWVALSGDPEDIYKTDAKVKELLPDDVHPHNWLDMARERIAFQGLPARICWVGLGDRDLLGSAFNAMVRDGELAAPVVVGRDHLDSGSVASPNRETEATADGSDAVAEWSLLNALINTASGATWVSIHHGGGPANCESALERFVLRSHAPCVMPTLDTTVPGNRRDTTASIFPAPTSSARWKPARTGGSTPSCSRFHWRGVVRFYLSRPRSTRSHLSCFRRGGGSLRRLPGRRIEPQSWRPALVLGNVSGWLPSDLTAWALTRDSSLAAILGATSPVIVALLAHKMLMHEPLTRQALGGVSL